MVEKELQSRVGQKSQRKKLQVLKYLKSGLVGIKKNKSGRI